jgi:hypothetical protein
MNNPDVLREGTSKEVIANYDFKITPPTDLSSSATLTELAAEGYVFFNHAGFSLNSGLAFDPLATLVAQKPELDCQTAVSKLAIFRGLPEAWCRTVIMARKEQWEIISRYLGAAASANRSSNTFLRTLLQHIPILDFVDLAKHSGWPEQSKTVMIHMYGIDGNKNCWHYKPLANDMFMSYRIIRDKPETATVKFAQSLFDFNPTPFNPKEITCTMKGINEHKQPG